MDAVKNGRVEIRQARLSDIEVILSFNRALFEHDVQYDETLCTDWPYSREGRRYFRKRISEPDGFVAMAEIDDDPIGYLCGKIAQSEDYREKAVCAEIENMYVQPKNRNQGIGTSLVKSFLKWCKANNAKRVLVTAYYENKRINRFYRKCGFQPAHYTFIARP